VVGGARPGFVLPQVDRNHVERYIKACHERGLEFSYLLNAPCLGNGSIRQGQILSPSVCPISSTW
jgi:hypothetical protein